MPQKSKSGSITTSSVQFNSVPTMLFSRYVSFWFISTSFAFFSAAANNAGQVLLPQPSGNFEVGVGILELIDESRIQPFAPTVQPVKLMVSLFYPVNSDEPTTPVKYFPPKTAAWEESWLYYIYGLATPKGTFEKLALQSAGNQPQIQGIPDFPIVLFSPGEATTRLFYSAIVQTIASSGYIVVTIDAPYIVDIVEYTDGSVAILNVTAADTAAPADIDLAISARAQDASFVLEQLRNTSVISQLIPGRSQGLNVSKVAMIGHSLGGAAAAAAMLNDSRIAGGLNMDGSLFGPVVQKGLDRPFMIMAQTTHNRTNDETWFDFWSNLRGWKLDINLANSRHYTFSDYPIVFETLGIVPNPAIADLLHWTDLNGSRALKIVTTYVTAFLDMVLKGKTSPLLEGPVAAFPEVTFER